MKNIVFWGTRGSLPIALTADDVRQKILSALKAANGLKFRSQQAMHEFVDTLPFATAGTFGGHSPCVEIVTGAAEHFICDMGSGARPLGQAKINTFGYPRPQTYHIFLSHLHWDHLMGFPFFTPIYVPGNRIIVHGCHEKMEEAVRLQMRAPCFPVDYSQVGSTVEFDRMTPGETRHIAGLMVTPLLQCHAGDSFGYRFESADKTVVYSTDSEHKQDDPGERQRFVNFFRNADLVIFDAMYSLADSASLKEDWGHSSNMVGVELCQAAGVRRLALFHHEPVHDDQQLSRILDETRRFEAISRLGAPLAVISAYDGLTVTL